MEEQNIVVPEQVVIDLRDIRDEGKYNMFDAQSVFCELYQKGCYKSVNWLYNEKWNGSQYKSQVDSKKYMAALTALGNLSGILQKLSEC